MLCVCVCVHECACLNRRVFFNIYFRDLNGQELNAVKEAFANFHFPLFQFDKDSCTYLKGLGTTVVKVLCYKSEGRWFDPSLCHWNFSLT